VEMHQLVSEFLRIKRPDPVALTLSRDVRHARGSVCVRSGDDPRMQNSPGNNKRFIQEQTTNHEHDPRSRCFDLNVWNNCNS